MFLSYVKSSEDIYIYVLIYIYIYIYTRIHIEGEGVRGVILYCMSPATCAYRRSSPTFSNHQPFICRLVLQLLASSHALGRDHPTAWEVSAKTTAHFGLPSPACFKLDSGPTVDTSGSNEGSPYKNLCCEHCRDGSWITANPEIRKHK